MIYMKISQVSKQIYCVVCLYIISSSIEIYLPYRTAVRRSEWEMAK